MKKHDINMIADWARDWGIEGFEHYDPKVREQRRMSGLKRMRERERKEENKNSFKK